MLRVKQMIEERTLKVKLLVFLAYVLVMAFIIAICPKNVSACDECYNGPYDYTVYYASVDSGYLALRTGKAYDYRNEIGCIYNGEPVYVVETPKETYWYVFAPGLNLWGYVNSNYLVKGCSYTCDIYTVKVESGYLALRNAQAYDSSNEIGRLYTGETVEVQNRTSGTYWYVYAPSLGQWGYVNRNYLIPGGNRNADVNRGNGKWVYTAKVESGYLALRTAKAFDYSNEIGRIYTGERVEVITKESGTYWYVYVPSLGLCGYTNKNYLF